jgi:hypothetical protein
MTKRKNMTQMQIRKEGMDKKLMLRKQNGNAKIKIII